MKTRKFSIFAAFMALCLILTAFSPAVSASAKTIKRGSKEYNKINDATDWIIFQTIYNLAGGYIDGKTDYKLTKEDFKAVFHSYLIDGNQDEYTKTELKKLSKELFGKSYVDKEFLSRLEKKGSKYWVNLGDPETVDYITDNKTITSKKGYIYISGDYVAMYDYDEEQTEKLGKLTFKFKKVGENYTLRGFILDPAK